MTIIELKNKFIATKQYEPIDANELLDFARQLYLRNELPLGAYRHLVRDLEALGAYKPDDERVEQYSGSIE
ncbi:YppF family protein [Anoxybacillus sp. LAT_35]|nr:MULTISPECIES: YppF family protein [Anoxybacillus]AST07029.1 hypothetical protein AF2641_09180 [Anoxybacillus flavithermus]MCG6196172.1 YppF family protein [Anoxybacillus sp. LAT_38]QAV26965.1 hypothetical protein BTDUT50_10205 [Neobacillus thermocopriae]ACJ33521.1 Uncharacterized conserved protein [Anoxybacillus flavithermus WK1]MCG3083389.1 YppF family protein [Anoxybacillus sp. LAT27]